MDTYKRSITKLIEAEKATLAEAQALKTGACDTIEEAREGRHDY